MCRRHGPHVCADVSPMCRRHGPHVYADGRPRSVRGPAGQRHPARVGELHHSVQLGAHHRYRQDRAAGVPRPRAVLPPGAVTETARYGAVQLGGRILSRGIWKLYLRLAWAACWARLAVIGREGPR
eukprot:5489698-Pyramimonas_sp.AAC.2